MAADERTRSRAIASTSEYPNSVLPAPQMRIASDGNLPVGDSILLSHGGIVAGYGMVKRAMHQALTPRFKMLLG